MTGKISVSSLSGTQNFVVLLDFSTATSEVYFISYKSQFLECLQVYTALSENESSHRMYRLYVDNTGEQRCHEVSRFVLENGVST